MGAGHSRLRGLSSANCEITFQPLEKNNNQKEMHTCTERQQFLYDERNRLENANPCDSNSRPLLSKRGVAARRPVTSFQSNVNQGDVESRDALDLLFPPSRSPLPFAVHLHRKCKRCPRVRPRWTNWTHVAPTGHFFSRLAIPTEATPHFLLCDIDFINRLFFFKDLLLIELIELARIHCNPQHVYFKATEQYFALTISPDVPGAIWAACYLSESKKKMTDCLSGWMRWAKNITVCLTRRRVRVKTRHLVSFAADWWPGVALVSISPLLKAPLSVVAPLGQLVDGRRLMCELYINKCVN